MPTSVVTLVDLPKSLRKGIERRLPRGGRFNDLSGRKYGHWLVIGFAGFRGRFAAWLCRCKCGKLSVIEGAQLGQSRRSQSCGCIGRLSSTARSMQSILNSIKSRCYRRSDPSFHRYGALGITVCQRWLDSAEAFVADMGPRPSQGHTLMRRDLAGNFTPENCFWGLGRTHGAPKNESVYEKLAATVKLLIFRSGPQSWASVARQCDSG
jgi:hypothetical protein